MAGEAAAAGAAPRARRSPTPTACSRPPTQAIETAGRATQDTVAVALEGYEAAPRARDRALQHAHGLRRRLRADAALDLGHPRRLVALPERRASAGATSTTSSRASCSPSRRRTAALLTEDERARAPRSRSRSAPGVGLTFDEAALLLDLRDVYWTREGVLSVQVSLGLAAILGGDDPRAADAAPRRAARRGAGPDPARLALAHDAVARVELSLVLAEPDRLERRAPARARPRAAPARFRRRAWERQSRTARRSARARRAGRGCGARPRRAATARRARREAFAAAR